MISFETTKEETLVISEIAKRAKKELPGFDDILETVMDLSACHANGCRLDFKKLKGADAFNFAHDLCGIRRHINRKTGEIENFFLPRCSMTNIPEGFLDEEPAREPTGNRVSDLGGI